MRVTPSSFPLAIHVIFAEVIALSTLKPAVPQCQGCLHSACSIFGTDTCCEGPRVFAKARGKLVLTSRGLQLYQPCPVSPVSMTLGPRVERLRSLET